MFGSNFVIDPSLPSKIAELIGNEQDVSMVLKGLIGVKNWPDYSLTRTQAGLNFIEKWTTQPNTMGTIVNNSIVCNQQMDNANEFYLYQNSNGSICSGLNFSSYNVNTKLMNPFAALTYDATLAMGYAISVVLKEGKALNNQRFSYALKHNVTFVGPSGLIKSDVGGRSDIEDGSKLLNDFYYRIMNYQTSNNSEIGTFVQVGIWNIANVLSDCPSDLICPQIIYRTIDNVIPSDSQPSIFLGMSFHIRLMIYLFIYCYNNYININC